MSKVEIGALAVRTIGDKLMLEVEHDGRWVRLGEWTMPGVLPDKRLVVSDIMEADEIRKRIEMSYTGPVPNPWAKNAPPPDWDEN